MPLASPGLTSGSAKLTMTCRYLDGVIDDVNEINVANTSALKDVTQESAASVCLSMCVLLSFPLFPSVSFALSVSGLLRASKLPFLNGFGRKRCTRPSVPLLRGCTHSGRLQRPPRIVTHSLLVPTKQVSLTKVEFTA